MKSLPCLLSGLLCMAPAVQAGDQHAAGALPPDVQAFKSRRDVCDYFRGGDASINKERIKETAERMKAYCAGTDKELATLKMKYKSDNTVIKALAGYTEKSE